MDFVSKLPVEVVLIHIFPRLNYTSWVRAGAVNHHWRHLAAQATPLGDDIPLICLSDRKLGSYLRAVSITEKNYNVSPVAFTSHSNSIVIPLNDPDIEKIAFFYNSKTGNSFPLISGRTQISSAFACRPTSPDSWAAAAFHAKSNYCNLHIRRSGWSRNHKFETNELSDLIFHKNKLYCVDQFREILAFDISPDFNGPPRVVISGRTEYYWRKNPQYTVYYLVESSSGELYVVTRDLSYAKLFEMNTKFTVHRVEEEKGKLVEVEDLGDEMLFVEQCCSKSIMYGSGSWSEPYFKRNCIYFFSMNYKHCSSRWKVGKYSMDKELASRYRLRFHEYWLPESYGRPLWIHPDA